MRKYLEFLVGALVTVAVTFVVIGAAVNSRSLQEAGVLAGFMAFVWFMVNGFDDDDE